MILSIPQLNHVSYINNIFLFAKIIIESAYMATEHFAALQQMYFLIFFVSATYGSSISDNIALVSKTIKFTIL